MSFAETPEGPAQISELVRSEGPIPVLFRLPKPAMPRPIVSGSPRRRLRSTSLISILTSSVPRDATLDKLLPHPFLRKAVMRLPKFLQPAPKRYSFVLGLDQYGRVVENLQNGEPGCYDQIANAVEYQGALYFGSIGESAVGRYELP